MPNRFGGAIVGRFIIRSKRGLYWLRASDVRADPTAEAGKADMAGRDERGLPSAERNAFGNRIFNLAIDRRCP